MKKICDKKIEDVFTFDNLYYIALQCCKGVRWKPSVSHFYLNSLEEISKLYESILDGSYKEKNFKIFKVYEPKEREVISIKFRDRVFQRTLDEKAIYPQITKSFIYDNAASQKEKGTDFVRNRLKKYMIGYYQSKHTNKGFFVHLDIRKYYNNLLHSITEQLLHDNFLSEINTIIDKILSKFPGDRGYVAGNQLIQIIGLAYLNKLDHYIKEQLRIKRYVRYMDDFIFIVETKEQAEYFVSKIREQLGEIGLELNEDKTTISSLYKGVDFLGFKFRIGNTGKIYQCLLSQNIKRRRRKLQSMEQNQFDT